MRGCEAGSELMVVAESFRNPVLPELVLVLRHSVRGVRCQVLQNGKDFLTGQFSHVGTRRTLNTAHLVNYTPAMFCCPGCAGQPGALLTADE